MKPLGALALALVAAALSGCGASREVRYYTLDAGPPAAAAADVYSVEVGPVTVPELVDRPHFVLRSAPSRVEIAEDVRWAAPLKSEIPRVVADQLAHLLPGARTFSSAQRASGRPDHRVLIDIQRFETSPAEGATIHALWTVRTQGGTSVSGSTLASEPAGAGFDALAAAHSRALKAVSRDIAAAIGAARAAK